jgi:hypothetical protein
MSKRDSSPHRRSTLPPSPTTKNDRGKRRRLCEDLSVTIWSICWDLRYTKRKLEAALYIRNPQDLGDALDMEDIECILDNMGRYFEVISVKDPKKGVTSMVSVDASLERKNVILKAIYSSGAAPRISEFPSWPAPSDLDSNSWFGYKFKRVRDVDLPPREDAFFCPG